MLRRTAPRAMLLTIQSCISAPILTQGGSRRAQRAPCYKGFVRSDEEGFIAKVHTTPANTGESPEFAAMIDGANAQRVLADKAYASKANRDMLRGRHRDGIMRKAVEAAPCGLRKSASTN